MVSLTSLGLEPGERLAMTLHEGEPEAGRLGSRRVENVDPIEVIIPKVGDIHATFPSVPTSLYEPYVSLWRGGRPPFEYVLTVRVDLGFHLPVKVVAGSDLTITMPPIFDINDFQP